MNSLLLAYAGPPVLGAFIGYLTNKVAIRMLFRPLHRLHIFGVRVPMTPGVIPGKRHELAENIGEMVGSHLLTSKDIGAALSEERFQEHLHVLVDKRVQDLLERELGTLPQLVPKRFQAYFKVAVRTIKYQLRMSVHRYLQSSDFEDKVARTVMEQLDDFGEKPLNDLFGPQERTAFYSFIEDLVGDIMAGEEAERWLAGYMRRYFEKSAADGKNIGDHLPGPLYDLIIDTILQHSPEILQQLARMLAEPPVRERIIKAVRGGVDNFMDSLGPLASLAGSFLDMNVLEEKVREYLVDNEENILLWLQSPEVQDRFSTVLVEQTRKFLDTPLARVLDRAAEEQLDAIFRGISVQVFAVLRSHGVKEAMSSMLRDNLEEMIGHGRQGIGDITSRVLSPETVKKFKQAAATESAALLRSQRVRKMLDRMMNSMFDAFLSRPVGVLHNILPAGVRTGITEYAVLSINRILLREVPGLVKSLNIQQIVTEKVDSLDLLKLERLLLSIMEEQFKYINLFGALLGFLIGLINLLILRLM
jgi:uncharacterized membrane protein YheB (UPF0754 family)